MRAVAVAGRSVWGGSGSRGVRTTGLALSAHGWPGIARPTCTKAWFRRRCRSVMLKALAPDRPHPRDASGAASALRFHFRQIGPDQYLCLSTPARPVGAPGAVLYVVHVGVVTVLSSGCEGAVHSVSSPRHALHGAPLVGRISATPSSICDNPHVRAGTSGHGRLPASAAPRPDRCRLNEQHCSRVSRHPPTALHQAAPAVGNNSMPRTTVAFFARSRSRSAAAARRAPWHAQMGSRAASGHGRRPAAMPMPDGGYAPPVRSSPV